MTRRAAAAAVVMGLLATLALPALPAVAATTNEVYATPVSGSFQLIGHGYGHGRGMSQWGARGAATRGLAHPDILAFYYPGTALATQQDSPIDVWLKADTDDALSVAAGPGLVASNDTASQPLPPATPDGAPISQWRVRRDAGGQFLEALVEASWVPYDLGGASRSASPVQINSASGLVRLVLPDDTRRDYRGALRAVPRGAVPGQRSVSAVLMEQYLRSVVPAEMPASWAAEALRSQAVAARTYASYERRAAGMADYDTCDDTACQVYRGVAAYRADGSLIARYEHPDSDAAVSDTANRVLHYAGEPAFTQFSASNGGYTVAGGKPYLPAQPDPYDGVVPSTAHTWRVGVSAAAIESRWAVGTLRRVRVAERDGNGEWGGRVVRVVLEGSAGSLEVSAADFRSRLGLRSTWWLPTNTARRGSDWNGDGLADLLAVATDGTLWLYPGNGRGAVLARARQRIGTGWSAMTTVTRPGDWDGDGRPDVLARRGDGTLWWYAGDGAGGWLSSQQIATGWSAMRAVLGPGDWSGDGNPDLLAVDTSGLLWLYPGTGTGGLGASRQVGHGWSGLDIVVPTGDWDGDGRPDLLARQSSTGALLLYAGDGSGGFGSSRPVGTGWNGMVHVVGAGDMDTDGAPDLLATDRGGILLLYSGDGTGGFRRVREVGWGWAGMAELL